VGGSDFPCTLCGTIYHLRNSLNYHMRYKHGVYASKSPKKVPKKQKLHVGKNKLSYNETTNSSNLPSSLDNHVQKAIDSDIYQCDQCDKSYKYAFSLKRHVEKSHLAKQTSKNVVKPTSRLKFRCKECPLVFLSKITRDQHSQSHMSPLIQEIPEDPFPAAFNFRCDFCTLAFTTKDSSDFHFKNVHMPVIQKVFAEKAKQKQSQPVSKYTCKVCQKKFMFQNTLDFHVKIHCKEAEISPNLSFLSKTDYPIEMEVDTEVVGCMETSNESERSSEEINTRVVIPTYMDCKENTSVLQRCPLIIFRESLPVKLNAIDKENETTKLIDEVISELSDRVANSQEFQAQVTENASIVSKSLKGPALLGSNSAVQKQTIGVAAKDDDAGNDADYSNLDTSTDGSQPSEDSPTDKSTGVLLTKPVRSTPSLSKSIKAPKSQSLLSKTHIIIKEASSRPTSRPKKTELSLKIPNCSLPIFSISSPVATSSPKIPDCSSPLITGVFDCPRGKLIPTTHYSSHVHPANNITLYSPDKKENYSPPPSRGIHPLLLPLYTKSSPPIHPSRSYFAHTRNYGYSSSTRNMNNNLISVFIQGRDGIQETTAATIDAVKGPKESEKDGSYHIKSDSERAGAGNDWHPEQSGGGCGDW